LLHLPRIRGRSKDPAWLKGEAKEDEPKVCLLSFFASRRLKIKGMGFSTIKIQKKVE
jgi:hypothetical protein